MPLRLALLATLLVAGCGGHGAHDDAGPAPTRDADLHFDAGPHGTAPTLAPCSDTTVCADAPGVACLTDIPGGACTRRCTADTDCGTHGTCVQNICLWSCTSGTGDCVAHAGACLQGDMQAYCTPICYPAGSEPAGYPSCGAGLVCDPYTSTCVTALAPGADDGAPCRDATECRGGECLLETNFTDGSATGFLDGMCVSYGIVPSLRSYTPGAPIARGSCPPGSAVMPVYAMGLEGDLAICFPTCVTDGDCRSGYACTHLESGGPAFANGLCLPLDCASATCPTGSSCGTTPDPWLGHVVCARTP